MSKHNLRIIPALLLGLAFVSTALASTFSMPSRTTFGPSLNKDVPVSSAGPGATGAPSTQAAPAGQAAPSTNIMPTMPTTPMSPPQQTNFEPAPKPTAMERAGQIVRSVLQKVDPGAKSVLHREGVVLKRDPNAPNVISTPSTTSATPPTVNSANASATPPTVNNANVANAASSAPADAPAPSAQPVQSKPTNISMNKQERNVKPGAAQDLQQLQRGLMNVQKVNVGSVQ